MVGVGGGRDGSVQEGRKEGPGGELDDDNLEGQASRVSSASQKEWLLQCWCVLVCRGYTGSVALTGGAMRWLLGVVLLLPGHCLPRFPGTTAGRLS